MGKDTGQEQIQMQAQKQVLVAREQQASLKTGVHACTLACTHTPPPAALTHTHRKR